MNTCKTCKHWVMPERGGHWITSPYDQDTGKPMVFEFEVRQCKSPALLFCERPITPDGFSVADGSEYFAALFTAEEFGCKQYAEAA